MFGRQKLCEFCQEPVPKKLYMAHLAACPKRLITDPEDPWYGRTVEERDGGRSSIVRAPRNPTQQLITREQAQQRTATELVVAAGDNVPALVSAVGTIAQRFEQFVGNIDALNRSLGEFKHEVMLPFKEELKYLRYTTGDRLNHVSHDLEGYVSKLDKVLWAALRAQGMTDDQIRTFRTEQGMTPEAPRGFELEAHIREFEALKTQNADLIRQNTRLLARMDGHHFENGEGEWLYKEACRCNVCIRHRQEMQTAAQEAARV